jgi:hypothetical protein
VAAVGGTLGQKKTHIQSTPGAAGHATTSQSSLAERVVRATLPFTGLLLALWASLGLASLLLGAGLRRSSVPVS